MPKTKISEFSATPGNNTDIDGINIAEGCSPSGINDAIRELMAQLKDFQAGTAGDSFNGPVGTTTAAAGAFTNLSASGTFALTGDQVQISEGGTGQTTANAAFNALAPSQSTHAGKYLKTDGTNTSWDALDISTADITGTLPVANGGTGVTSSTGTGSVVLSASPTFTGTVNGASLTLSSNFTLSGGTANGVAYLNGSKVLTTGSALTFDGTNLGVGASPTFYGGQVATAGSIAITGGNLLKLWNTGGTGVGGISSPGTDTLAFGLGSGFSEQMRLTSTGLGIGTSSPTRKLTVSGSGVFTDGTNDLTVWNDGSVGTNGSVNLKFNTAGTLKATLDTSGNLGLGVTPSAWGQLRAIDISTSGAVFGFSSQAGIANNTYYNGANFIYKNTAAAAYFRVNGGASEWFTAPSGTAGNTISFTQAMTLDASGNLGVGSTSITPAYGYTKVIEVAGQFPGIKFAPSGASTFGFQIGAGTGGFQFYDVTAATERARITSGGYFLVGTTSASGKFVSSTSANTEYSGWFESSAATGGLRGVQIKYSGQSPNSAGEVMFVCADSTATRAYINSNGGFGNYQANDVNLSDRREKTNFAPAKDYLDTICAIPVQTFNYIDQSENDPGLTLGVVAQDVQAVAPELVMESNWGTEDNPKMRLSIYQTDLQYALMKCIQELKAELDTVKAELATLKGN